MGAKKTSNSSKGSKGRASASSTARPTSSRQSRLLEFSLDELLASDPFFDRTVAVVAALGLVLLIAITDQQVVHPDQPGYVPTVAQAPIAVFPDFASIDDVVVKKQQFFDYLQDYVDAENRRMRRLRRELQPMVDLLRVSSSLSERELERLLEIAEEFGIDGEYDDYVALANELMLRVDTIPASLVLAQAANESAWGTSRFALQGNNLFGQWCYEEGCGIVPRRRPVGASHEVKSFDSVAESVAAYFRNINTNQSYAYLRELRQQMRRNGETIDSMVLASGLGRYSQRGDHYVDEVQTIIAQNDLNERDGG